MPATEGNGVLDAVHAPIKLLFPSELVRTHATVPDKLGQRRLTLGLIGLSIFVAKAEQYGPHIPAAHLHTPRHPEYESLLVHA